MASWPMLSLYRRHRPKTFDEVVGQEHIVKTLRNAIELGKVHHAYLFVGSRGTGKTSVAKLLACALNAEGGPSADFDPDAPAARAIMGGTSLDVVEMDAASNNSVDDIRELRENVALAPMGGSRRVYILDEAHMLTTQAWNAFLKTLEEPPPHVVFVLATTEAHKVPATIIDRCHQFRFHRPSLNQVAGVVKKVAAQEQIQVPDAAVGMIARSATGSFRDALGTLEQMVTYGGRELALDDVLEVLGVADAALVLDTTEALADHDPRAALLAVRRLTDSGLDLPSSCASSPRTCATSTRCRSWARCPSPSLSPPSTPSRLTAQAERLKQAELLRAIDLLAAALAAVKEGSEPLIQLEVALLKATQPQADASLQALMFRIEQLEGRVAGAAPQQTSGGGQEGPPASRLRPATRRRWPAPQRRQRAGRRRRGGRGARRGAAGAGDQLRAHLRAVARAVRGSAGEQRDGGRGAQGGPARGAGGREADRHLRRGRRVHAQEGRGQRGAAARRCARADRPVAGAWIRARRADGGAGGAQRGGADRRAEGEHGRRRGLRGRTGRGAELMAQQPNLNQMMKQVQAMQAEVAKAQETLKDETVEATAGGGMVKVVMSGDLELKQLTIDPDAVDPEDVELLQDMVTAAVTEALRSAQELAASKMGAATGGLGGMGLPGL